MPWGMSVKVAVAVALFIAACSSSPDASPPAGPLDAGADAAAVDAAEAAADAGITLVLGHGGARIKMRYAQAPDGQVVGYQGAFDTELGAECFPNRLADGRFYCLPGGLGDVATQDRMHFADDACTIPVAAAPPNCMAPRFVLQHNDDANYCRVSYSIAGVGAKVDVGNVHFRSPGSPNCTAVSGPDLSQEYFLVDAAKPPPSLVGYTSTTRSLGSRIAMKVLAGEDGSEHSTSWLVDQSRARDCFAAEASDGRVRCVPSARWQFTTIFYDAQCTQAGLGERACPNPLVSEDDDYAVERIPRCGRALVGARAFELAQLSVSKNYSKAADGSCTYVQDFDATTARTNGAEVPPNRMPAFVTTLAGSSRVRASALADSTGMILTHAFDTQLDRPCSPFVASDGKLRCLPLGGVSASLFADAACTQRIASGACDSPAFAYLLPVYACGDRSAKVYPVTGPYVAPAGNVWADVAGAGCSAVDAAGRSLWSLGPESPPDTFAELTIVER